ncbi:MAG: FG-GAP-like repeat-containing protein [Acidobacteriia bacterium]|nr:FG-GAP-like repeat-containing protein [Terriglobia bacterium]
MSKPYLTGCLVLLLTPQLSAQFQSPANYAVGSNPYSVAVGDFNQDGHPDLAVTNSDAGTSNGVSVLLGNGDGTFQPHVDYATGTRPTSVVAADFNRDGKLDLAVTNGSADSVSVLLGKGDGTFQPHVDYATDLNPQWLAVADFNADGYLDIATANYGPDYSYGSVSIFLGNGDGTFRSQVTYAAGVNPFGVMVGDFNRDGRPDLAVVNNNGWFGVQILIGNGDGSFQSPVYYATGMNPRVGVVADFNSDGNLDLAIANCIQNNVSILLGDGNGHFSSPVNYPAGAYIGKLAGGDFNGDGKLDLVTANSASNNISVLKGNGDATFQSNVDYATGNGARWVEVADLNHDKAPDLIVTNASDNTITVFLNTGIDFSISASPASPGTVSRGHSSTSTVTLNLLNAFDNPVTLACSVQPTQSAPACSFSPNPVTFDANGNATATLTINTGAATASLGSSSLRHDSRQPQFLWLPVAGFALIGAGFGFRRATRRKLAVCVLGGLLLGGLIFQTACGSASSGGPHSQTIYTITITGTSGTTQHSATTSLTVQ